jgi:T4 superinfection immunity protein
MSIIVIMLIMYFIPMIIALARGCDNAGAMIAVSLLLGWFPLVTIVCIFWAICGATKQKQLARAEVLANAIVKAQRA